MYIVLYCITHAIRFSLVMLHSHTQRTSFTSSVCLLTSPSCGHWEQFLFWSSMRQWGTISLCVSWSCFLNVFLHAIFKWPRTNCGYLPNTSQFYLKIKLITSTFRVWITFAWRKSAESKRQATPVAPPIDSPHLISPQRRQALEQTTQALPGVRPAERRPLGKSPRVEAPLVVKSLWKSLEINRATARVFTSTGWYLPGRYPYWSSLNPSIIKPPPSSEPTQNSWNK